MAFQSLVSDTIHLPVDGTVVMHGLAVQGFSAGEKPWAFVFLIDGEVRISTGQRQATQDLVPIYATKQCVGAPRDVSYEVRWSGDASIHMESCDVTVLGFPNTSG